MKVRDVPRRLTRRRNERVVRGVGVGELLGERSIEMVGVVVVVGRRGVVEV